MLIVQKYGGSSLAAPERVMTAAGRIVSAVRQGAEVVAVVSAQGDTTDHLISAAGEITASPSARELDACLAAGEQVSAALVAMAVEKLGVPAVSLTGHQAGLQTDGVYGNARVVSLEDDRIRRELAAGKVVVVAGFQGIGPDGDTVTLGRGGSDTTAVALAAFLKADRCMIYTDVDGVYDRDPRLHPDAVKFDRIGYDQMLSLARQGAQVLHDRCVEAAQQYGVRIQVLSSFRPGNGTMVEDME